MCLLKWSEGNNGCYTVSYIILTAVGRESRARGAKCCIPCLIYYTLAYLLSTESTVECSLRVTVIHFSSHVTRCHRNKECPTCRQKLVSKRSLRPDKNIDELISKLYPHRDIDMEVQVRKITQMREDLVLGGTCIWLHLCICSALIDVWSLSLELVHFCSFLVWSILVCTNWCVHVPVGVWVWECSVCCFRGSRC